MARSSEKSPSVPILTSHTDIKLSTKSRTLWMKFRSSTKKRKKTLKKQQENDSWEFKQKQELELQAFLKKQREDATAFKHGQMNQYNDLKERHTQETWKLFGAKAPANTRPSITSMWEQRTNNSSRESSRNSPWSPSSTSNAPSPTSWSKQNPWTPSNGEKDKKITYWNS